MSPPLTLWWFVEGERDWCQAWLQPVKLLGHTLHLLCSSAGLEILEDVPSPDIVVICCGGGGLLSGVASAIKLSGHKNTRVIGVEPEGGQWNRFIFQERGGGGGLDK